MIEGFQNLSNICFKKREQDKQTQIRTYLKQNE